MRALEPVTLEEVHDAARRIAGAALRTPLVPLNINASGREIWLKLENLQPIGSFKLRGATNAMRAAPVESLRGGVYTASAGNMAQGVAWAARDMGIPCTVLVPDSAPETKLAAVTRLGGRIRKAPFAEWWQTLVDHGHPQMEGFFVHPVSDPMVIAGNATVGLEIIDELADVDTILVPYGGGGLSCGIASAVRALGRDMAVYGCEVATAAPLDASFRLGEAATIERVPSFVDGIGASGVLREMWPLARALLRGSAVVSLEETAGAIRLLAERNHVIAEGAGAAGVAAALSGRTPGRKIVCVVSGGNIDAGPLAAILAGGLPA